MKLLGAQTTVEMDNIEADTYLAVKFDTEQLPEILNALETDNGGNKLILEVSVRINTVTIVWKGHQTDMSATATFG
jgi:F0F1-type ATP synthase beta subunit